jgi:hypothetical protein
MLFMIGTFSALSPAVIATMRPGSCGTDAYSWWTAFPYLLGDVIWLFACYLQLVESLNMDYEMRVEVRIATFIYERFLQPFPPGSHRSRLQANLLRCEAMVVLKLLLSKTQVWASRKVSYTARFPCFQR